MTQSAQWGRLSENSNNEIEKNIENRKVEDDIKEKKREDIPRSLR